MAAIINLFTEEEVLQRGLVYCGQPVFKRSPLAAKSNHELFCKHYGSSPLVLAKMWADLIITNRLGPKEATENGFKMFLAAQFFLWTYPKNSTILAARFRLGKNAAHGATFWAWVERLASLKDIKIVWPTYSQNRFYLVSVDGIDFRTWEKKHPTLSRNPKNSSHKFGNKCAVKYEIALDTFESRCLWINGPFRGGKADITIFQEGLKLKLSQDGMKLGIADRGYGGEPVLLSTPNNRDSPELRNFKTRVRMRHETFNGRITKFACLSNTWRHSWDKHKIAMEAICVIVQYQMENGAPLYDP